MRAFKNGYNIVKRYLYEARLGKNNNPLRLALSCEYVGASRTVGFLDILCSWMFVLLKAKIHFSSIFVTAVVGSQISSNLVFACCL